jgi:hypothetical protein
MSQSHGTYHPERLQSFAAVALASGANSKELALQRLLSPRQLLLLNAILSLSVDKRKSLPIGPVSPFHHRHLKRML